jgi:hypothetical protein
MIDLSLVPEELKQGKAWVLWNAEKRGQSSKTTKVPYQANMRKASSTDESTWECLDNILPVHEKFSGIGRVITKGFLGVDIDGCVEDSYGNLAPWAEEIMNVLPKTYTEISPSGLGVKLWFFFADEFPSTCKNKRGGFGNNGAIECYPSNGRYFTLTGISWYEDEVVPIATLSTPQLLAFASKAQLEREVLSTGKTDRVELLPRSFDYDQRMKAMFNSRNGAVIMSLHRNQTPANDNQGQSGNDMAYLNHLAFWLDCDKSLMDRTFRESARFRDKWDEKHRGDGATYGEMSLDRAISGCTNRLEAMKSTEPLEFVIDDKERQEIIKTEGWLPFRPLESKVPDIDPRLLSSVPTNPLRRIVEDTHASFGTPYSVATMIALSCISTACAGSFVVNSGVFTQPSSFYFCGVGDSGVNKSAPYVRITRPLYQWEEDIKKDVDRAKKVREFYTKKQVLAKLQKEIVQSEQDGAVHEVKSLREKESTLIAEMNEMNCEHVPRMTIGDATTESVVRIASENRGPAALFSDEPNILQDICGRYNSTSNLDPYLKGYDAALPVTQDRVSAENSRHVSLLTMNICIFSQPKILINFFKKRDLMDSGLFGRFVFIFPNWPLRTEVDIYGRPQKSSSIDDNWGDFIRKVLAISRPEGFPLETPITYTISKEAQAYLVQQGRQIDKDIDYGWLGAGDMKPWASKMLSRILRLSLLLHIANKPYLSGDNTISLDCVRNATSIIWCYAKHTARVYECAGNGGYIELAKDLFDWVCKNADEDNSYSESEAKDKNKSRFQERNSFDEVVGMLVDRGYLTIKSVKKSRGPAKRMLLINPEAIRVF